MLSKDTPELYISSYHFHVTLQLADAGSLALGGAHVTEVVDGDGRTDTGVQLSDCKQTSKKKKKKKT